MEGDSLRRAAGVSGGDGLSVELSLMPAPSRRPRMTGEENVRASSKLNEVHAPTRIVRAGTGEFFRDEQNRVAERGTIWKRDAARRPEAGGRLDAGGARRGVRRHRHQPALHRPDLLQRFHRAETHARQRARHAVADHLGADHRRHPEIRHRRHARRQSRRGRRAGADGAGVARARHLGAPAQRLCHPGHAGRRAVLRRLPADARHLGAERRRGPERGHARLRAGDPADRHGRADRPVRHAALRHRRHRPSVRADHADLVRHPVRAGRRARSCSSPRC